MNNNIILSKELIISKVKPTILLVKPRYGAPELQSLNRAAAMVTASQPGIESRPKFGPSPISPRRIFSRRSLRVAVCSHQGLVRKTRESIKRGDTTAEEVTLAYLDSIQRSDGVVGSFISITSDLALEQAKAVDKQLASGNDPGLLAGVPIAIKDNICISTGTTTAGSKLLQAHQSPYDAQIVHALKASGAVIVGKTNLDEFGMGSTTESSAFKATRNPWDESRVPGGSSGRVGRCRRHATVRRGRWE